MKWLYYLFPVVLLFLLIRRFMLGKSIAHSASDRNVKAFLYMIRRCEGTADDDGYYRLFGSRSGRQFSDMSKHPNVKVPFRNTYSTAAGAYQFLYRTWEGKRVLLGLKDFSPLSQDLAAIDILREKSALNLIKEGRITEAIGKVKKVWASLPGAGYGQPEKTLEQCIAYYKTAAGQIVS